jgi:uncharacterized membrane protein
MRRFTTRDLTLAALIAAVYAALTMLLPAYGEIQLRVSEAMTVLPFLFPAAIPGLAVGCFIVNLFSPYPLDILFGTLATLLAGLLTARCRNKWLAPLPPVICNGLIVGALLAWYETGFTAAFPAVFAFNAVSVGGAELLVCYVLGLPLLEVLSRSRVLPQRTAE